jgi:hypothetical protein
MSIDRKALKGEKSIFRLPISNTLGIEAIEARAKLKDFALQQPAEYSKMRNEVYIGVVKSMVENAHDTLWNLLATGAMPSGDKIQVAGKEWSPNLPDQEIGRLANGYAESMMSAFEDIMNKVLPDDYKALSEDKQMNIAKVEGIARAVA